MARQSLPRRLLLACLFAVLPWSSVSLAAPALRADMVNSLEALQQQLAQGENATVAKRAARAAERLVGGNAADRWARGLFLQIAGTAQARQGHETQAADLFATARRIEGIEPERRGQWLEQEARLRLRAGQTRQGVELLSRWLDQAQGQDSDFWLMAQALASLERWSDAAGWADRALQAGTPPSVRHRELAASIYQRAKRSDEALGMLDTLLDQDSDDPATWRRAAALAQRLDNPGQAAAIWDAGWRRGVLQGDAALLQLVKLHMAGGTPARGAEYLASALDQGRLEDTPDHLRLLARAWSAARDRENGLAAWHDVASQSGQSDDWRQLGELAYGWGRWQVAIDALERAREAGEPSAGDWLLEGIAQLALDRPKRARQAFEAARQAGNEQADAWLKAVADEERYAKANNLPRPAEKTPE